MLGLNFSQTQKQVLIFNFQIYIGFDICVLDPLSTLQIYTVKPVNKGHPRERLDMAFIYRWPLFGGNFVIFYKGRDFEVWPLFTGWSLLGGGL